MSSNRKRHQLSLAFEKQHGPVRYEEEPSIGMITDMILRTSFMEEVTNN